MTLGEQRRAFTRDLARLILRAISMGYEVQLDGVRRPQVAADYYASQGIGIRKSLHLKGLADDMDLFRDGVLLTDSDDYEPLGVYWESLNPLNCWGGRFRNRDGRHFSSTRGGVK